MQNDLGAIVKDMGDNYFTFKGESYFCIPSSLTKNKVMEIGGLEAVADKVLTVNKTAFTDGILPESLEFLTYEAKEYRIVQVVTNGNSAFIRLYLVDKNKGV